VIEFPKLVKPQDGDKAPKWFHIAVALSMVLSAAASLVGALRTSAAMQSLVDQNARMVKASSTPILQWGTSNANEQGQPEIRYVVENAGTGPARIVWFELRYKGQALGTHWDLLKTLNSQSPDPRALEHLNLFTSTIAPTILVAGRSTTLFRWPIPAENQAEGRALWGVLNTERHQLDAEACFCSVFDECWTSHMQGDVPKPVPRCEPAGHTSVQG